MKGRPGRKGRSHGKRVNNLTRASQPISTTSIVPQKLVSSIFIYIFNELKFGFKFYSFCNSSITQNANVEFFSTPRVQEAKEVDLQN